MNTLPPKIDIDGGEGLFLLPFAKRQLARFKKLLPFGKRQWKFPTEEEVTIWWGLTRDRIRIVAARNMRWFDLTAHPSVSFRFKEPYFTRYLFTPEGVKFSPLSIEAIEQLVPGSAFHERYILNALKADKPPAILNKAIPTVYLDTDLPTYFNPETGEFRIDTTRLAVDYPEDRIAYLNPFDINFGVVSIDENEVPTFDNNSITVNSGQVDPINWPTIPVQSSVICPTTWKYAVTTYTPDLGTVHSVGEYGRQKEAMVGNSQTSGPTGTFLTDNHISISETCPLIAHNGTFSWGLVNATIFGHGFVVSDFVPADITGAVVSRFLLGKALGTDAIDQIDVYAEGKIKVGDVEICPGIGDVVHYDSPIAIASDCVIDYFVVNPGSFLNYNDRSTIVLYDTTRETKTFLDYPPLPADHSLGIGLIFDPTKGHYAYLKALAGFDAAQQAFLLDSSESNKTTLRLTYEVIINNGISDAWLYFFRPNETLGPLKELGA